MRQIAAIHIHHSGAPWSTAVSIHRYHTLNLGWSDTGYHVVIERTGAMVDARPIERQPASISGHNVGALAVCLCGDMENQHPTDGQIQALVDLLERWCREYSLPVSAIYGHRELVEDNPCPGQHADMNRIRAAVAARLEATR